MAEVELDPTAPLDHEKCDRLAELVEELTTSGKETLEQEPIKELKKICKQGDNYVKLAYCQASSQLEKDHAEIRLSAFQIINELFVRSHCMRDLFLQDFQEVMDLTLETDPSRPLPPPKAAAKKLKEEVTMAIQNWQDKFGAHYKKLALGYNYLKTCKKVNFAAGVAETLAEQRRAQLLREKQQKQIQKQLENALTELAESKQEIRSSLLQVESCLRLILPDPEEFSFPDLLSPDPDTTTSDNKMDTSKETKVENSSDVKSSHMEDKGNKKQKDEKGKGGATEKEHQKQDSKRDNAKEKERDKSQRDQDKHKSKHHKSRSERDRQKSRSEKDSQKSRSDKDSQKSRSEKDNRKSRSDEKSSKEKSHNSTSEKEHHKSRSHEKSSKDKSHKSSSSSKSSHHERKSGECRSGHSERRSTEEKSHSSKSKEKGSEKRRDSKSGSDSDRNRSSSYRSRSEKDKSGSDSDKCRSSKSEKDKSRTEKLTNSSVLKDGEKKQSKRKGIDNDLQQSTVEETEQTTETHELELKNENTETSPMEVTVTEIKKEPSDQFDNTCNKTTENSTKRTALEESNETSMSSKRIKIESEVSESTEEKSAENLETVSDMSNSATPCPEDATHSNTKDSVRDTTVQSDRTGPKAAAGDVMDFQDGDSAKVEDVEGNDGKNDIASVGDGDITEIKDDGATGNTNDKLCADSQGDEIKDVKDPKEGDASGDETCPESNADEIKDAKDPKENNTEAKTCSEPNTEEVKDVNPKENDITEAKACSEPNTEEIRDANQKENDITKAKTCSNSQVDEIKDANPKETATNDTKTRSDSHEDDIKNPNEDDDDDTEGIDDELDNEEEVDYSEEELEAGYVRHRGLGGQQFSVNIEIRPDVLSIKETDDNADVLNVLRDTMALIDNKFLPAIQKWMTAFTKAGSQENIRKALDLKELVETARKRIMKLQITGKNGQMKTVLDEDEDSDFEEVPDAPITHPALAEPLLKKKSSLIEPQDKIAEKIPLTNKSWSLSERVKEGEELDPTSYAAAMKLVAEARGKTEVKPSTSTQPQPSTSSGQVDPEAERRRQELLKAAPRLPYNTDLSHWGQEIETPLMISYDSERRFWAPNSTNEDRVDQSALSAMTSRVMTYTGEFEPVKWECRAPLPSGKLCPRMDRYKCPFHGKVIARDQMGNPTDPKDIAELRKEREKKQEEETPEWEDPELQREIAAATGVDVSRKAKGKGKNPKKGKGKYPNLTNIKKMQDTGRRRLEKKVLNARAISRVAHALNTVDAKKVRDKFGDQFHYSLKNSGHS